MKGRRLTDINDHRDEVSLLDLLVVIAESWVILLVVPVIAAMLAFASFTLLDDPEHEAQAILRLSKEDAALLTSARVLDPAIVQSGWLERYSGRVSLARERLIASISTSPVEDTGTYRLTLSANSPETATATLQVIIASLIENSAPSADSRELLELRLSNLKRSHEVGQASLMRINSLFDVVTAEALQSGTIELGSLGASIASLVSQISTTEEAIWRTSMALDGSISASDVVQPPVVTVPASFRSSALRSILVGAGVGFVLLIVVFARAGLRSAASDPVSLSKVNRIRRAFWLRPKLIEPQS
jgi:hypothetical protein